MIHASSSPCVSPCLNPALQFLPPHAIASQYVFVWHCTCALLLIFFPRFFFVSARAFTNTAK